LIDTVIVKVCCPVAAAVAGFRRNPKEVAVGWPITVTVIAKGQVSSGIVAGVVIVIVLDP
jgi:hypothetical protein